MMQVKVFLNNLCQTILMISIFLISLNLIDQSDGFFMGDRQLQQRTSNLTKTTNETNRINNVFSSKRSNLETMALPISENKNKTISMKNETIRSRNLDDISHRLDNWLRPARDSMLSEGQQQQQQQFAADGQDGDTRVPFWNIAHMINSIEQIDLALSNGANGIETDVSFNERGLPIEAYHGFPCDCGRHCHYRENFIKFVQHLSRITNPPETSRLQLVLFDLKLKSLKNEAQLDLAGKYLAKIIYENLYLPYEQIMNIRSSSAYSTAFHQQPPLRVIISINHAKDFPLVRSFLNELSRQNWLFMRQQVGFDVGMNDNLLEISSMWNNLMLNISSGSINGDGKYGKLINIWQGDGLTNCANIVRGIERLKQAIQLRNEHNYFRKIYYWTADILYHIRSILRLGIDALLTNQPQRVLQALNEPEFRFKYRLATPYDDPFEQYSIEPTKWKMSVPTLNEAAETVHNLHKTSQDFIKTLPDGISAALKKVQAKII